MFRTLTERSRLGTERAEVCRDGPHEDSRGPRRFGCRSRTVPRKWWWRSEIFRILRAGCHRVPDRIAFGCPRDLRGCAMGGVAGPYGVVSGDPGVDFVRELRVKTCSKGIRRGHWGVSGTGWDICVPAASIVCAAANRGRCRIAQSGMSADLDARRIWFSAVRH
jgi:hypothetical protein